MFKQGFQRFLLIDDQSKNELDLTAIEYRSQINNDSGFLLECLKDFKLKDNNFTNFSQNQTVHSPQKNQLHSVLEGKRRKKYKKTLRQDIALVQSRISSNSNLYPDRQAWCVLKTEPDQQQQNLSSRYPRRKKTGRLLFWCEKGKYKGGQLVGIETKMPERWNGRRL